LRIEEGLESEGGTKVEVAAELVGEAKQGKQMACRPVQAANSKHTRAKRMRSPEFIPTKSGVIPFKVPDGASELYFRKRGSREGTGTGPEKRPTGSYKWEKGKKRSTHRKEVVDVREEENDKIIEIVEFPWKSSS